MSGLYRVVYVRARVDFILGSSRWNNPLPISKICDVFRPSRTNRLRRAIHCEEINLVNFSWGVSIGCAHSPSDFALRFILQFRRNKCNERSFEWVDLEVWDEEIRVYIYIYCSIRQVKHKKTRYLV